MSMVHSPPSASTRSRSGQENPNQDSLSQPDPANETEVACEKLRKSKRVLNGILKRKKTEVYTVALATLEVDSDFKRLLNLPSPVPTDIFHTLENQTINTVERGPSIS